MAVNLLTDALRRFDDVADLTAEAVLAVGTVGARALTRLPVPGRTPEPRPLAPVERPSRTSAAAGLNGGAGTGAGDR